MEKKTASVRVGYDFLRNLGNFENVHIKIEVEDSVREGENVEACFQRVRAFVQAKLIEQAADIEAELKTL